MKLSRRLVLRGVGGAALTLPFLESVGRTTPARADAEGTFAIFFRQANGVAAAQTTDVGMEPERFWPRTTGPLTTDSMMGRAVGELVDYRQRIVAVGNVNQAGFDYGGLSSHSSWWLAERPTTPASSAAALRSRASSTSPTRFTVCSLRGG